MLLIPLLHSLRRLPLMLQFPPDCQLKPAMQHLRHSTTRCSIIPWLFLLILDIPTNIRICKPASLSYIHNIHNIRHNQLIQIHTLLQGLHLPPHRHRVLGVKLILNSSIPSNLPPISYLHPLHHSSNMHNISHTCLPLINNHRCPLLLLMWCNIIIINLIIINLIKIPILLFSIIHFSSNLPNSNNNNNNNSSHNNSNYLLLERPLLFQPLLIPVVRMLSTNQNATLQLVTIH